MFPPDSSLLAPEPSPSQPKLRRLASKPLKLAASTFKRTASPAPSIASTTSTLLPDGDSAGGTNPPSSGSGTVVSTGTGTGGGGKSGKGPGGQIRRIGRRKHQRLSSQGLTPAQIASAAKGPRKPLDGEEPAGMLRVRVVRAQGLVAKDRSGTSDPFVTLVVPPSSRQSTPVVKKSLNPIFPAESSTFDFPLYLSLAGVVGGRGIEGVIWDKDLMRKEYMGELAIPALDWFDDGDVKLWDENLPLLHRNLLSTRRKHRVSGTISFQIGFLSLKGTSDREAALQKARRLYGAFVDQAGIGRGQVGVLGVPAHEGIGTIKMRPHQDPSPLAPSAAAVQDKSAMALLHSATAAVVSPFAGSHRMVPAPGQEDDDDDEEYDELLADDGLSSSSDDDFEDAIDEEAVQDSPSELDTLNDAMYSTTVSVPGPKPSDAPKTAALSVPPQPQRTPSRQSSLPGYFDSARPDSEASLSIPPTPSGVSTPGGSKTKKPIFRRKKSGMSTRKPTKDFNFNAQSGKDVLGIVVMEIKGATDLPKLKSSLRVTFDMDPFVVISFGKKVFRTRVIRHSLNPNWDEKLLFHVRRHEAGYVTHFSVLDWDKVSGNDMVGTCILPISELVSDAPKPNPETGLYGKEEDGKHEMREFTIPLVVDKDQPWESKYSPKLTVRAKYEPYDALRQRFWRQYMTQYDADDTGTMSYTELSTMLDSLGSTLTKKTIEGYFSSCGKDPDRGELTFEEVVHCLEAEVTKDRSQKAKVSKTDDLDTTGLMTPSMAPQPDNQGLAMTGPQENISSPVDPDELADHIKKSRPRRDLSSGENDQAKPGNLRAAPLPDNVPAVKVSTTGAEDIAVPPEDGLASGIVTPGSITSDVDMDDDSAGTPDDRERIINIRTCPLCHRPRLGKRTEQDIVTHLAICASADWSRVDRIVTANYVTSSQAQRKFFTKLVNKVAIGAYSLGANSANILVQDRRTGQLQEEKMAVYVRLGIRVLYKGAKSRMEGARARKLLKNMSIKQGLKYDSPSSALDIPSFIAFHNLPVDEILDPISSFKTFNEFFYRKLKPEARPVECPDDNGRLVSCADCRMMAFETVNEATSIWIKGREFSVGRLLGPNYKSVASRFEGGGLGIFRLAPQDYHRFHSPVKGKVGKMTMIDGEYYTVNPQAIRTTLDVYGENVRKIVPIETEEFGLVMTVWVGAMMVGSILTTVEEGQEVNRADELGYFAFGGSTIVCLFEKGALAWDDDLLQNGRASIETLVRMGSGIGRSTRGRE